MSIENCPKCGGTHFGSFTCPFTTKQPKQEEMKLKTYIEALIERLNAGKLTEDEFFRMVRDAIREEEEISKAHSGGCKP